MASDEEISLEETNRIRKSLGLPLIPVPQEPSSAPLVESSPGDGGISLEETNRIRASLGQKPIPIPAKTGGDEKDDDSSHMKDDDELAYENWLQKTENEYKLAHQDKIRKRIHEARERAERRKVLEGGRGLADEQDGNEDRPGTKSWIEKFRKKQRELQQRRLQNEEDEEHDSGLGEAKSSKRTKSKKGSSGYFSKDLSGLRVGHNIKDIQDLNQDSVLILKDSDVLDDDGENELISSSLLEKEKLKENRKNLKGKSKYAYEDEEEGNKDEDSKDKNFFVLDGSEIVADNSRQSDEKDESKSHLEKQSIMLDFGEFGTRAQQVSDYQEAKPVKFKKPKKTKKLDSKNKKRKRFDDDDESIPVNSPKQDDDDDYLQNVLSLNRRRVQIQRANKRKKLTPEELAERLLADKEQENEEERSQDLKDDKRLVISNTTDFLALVRQNSVEPDDESEPKQRLHDHSKVDDDENKPEEIIVPPIEETDYKANDTSSIPIEASTIAPEEPNLDGGLADVLKLLQTKGVIKKKTEEEIEKERRIKQQRDWIRQSEKDRLINEIKLQRQREEDRKDGNYDRLTHKDREEISQHENKIREQNEAQAAQKRFANYKPDIKIEYRDDLGNVLSTKEAFKHMSRQFHGTGAGKKRVERQLQKLDVERQKESESLFQVNTGDSSTTKKTKAGVRLQ